MLSCREVSRIIASDELSEMGWTGRLSVRLHLFWCRHCRRYRAQIEVLGRAARHVFGEPTSGIALDRLEKSILDRLPPGPPDPEAPSR